MRTLIVLGGSPPPEHLMRDALAWAEFIVCADSGARSLPQGTLPHLLVGDMDSIGGGDGALERSGVEVLRRAAEKDETDGQLALDEAIARGADDILLLGASGSRIDHVLGNLMLLVRAAQRGVRAVLRDGVSEVWAATGEVEIVGQAGQTVSLLPVGSGVTVRYLDGMQYGTLEPLALPPDMPVGVSNMLTADTAHVVIDGWALVVKNNGE